MTGPTGLPRLRVLAVAFWAAAVASPGAANGTGEETGDGSPATTSEVAVLDLDSGRVVIALRADLAPLHVERIRTLANEGFYDGVVWHRVIDGFMAQTGDPTGTGRGGSELSDLPAEFTRDVSFGRGTVGMARTSDPDSANSQFFICFEDCSFLDGQLHHLGRSRRRHGPGQRSRPRRAAAQSGPDRAASGASRRLTPRGDQHPPSLGPPLPRLSGLSEPSCHRDDRRAGNGR